LLSCTLLTSVVIHPTSFLQLFCYVHGDDPDHVFEIKIGNEESVAALKDAIKEKKSQMFHDVDADSLVLWKFSVPFDLNLKENVEKLRRIRAGLPHVPPQLNDEHILSLLPMRKLSDVFSEPPIAEHVHIIVKPPPSRSMVEPANTKEKDDIVTALRTRACFFLNPIWHLF
jgi:hypothetical protein